MNRWVLLRLGMLSVAFSLVTVLLGWWGVPLLAGVWGLYDNEANRPALVASFAGGLGWGMLLIWTATQGPLLHLAQRASGVMGVPSFTLFALTLMFPMALAWGAGVLGMTTRFYWQKRRHAD
jgi:hypothetical protein